MNQGFAIKDLEGNLTCFTETSEDSIKWHVAGYEAFIQKRAVDPDRIMRGWLSQTEAGWSCVEAGMIEATENAAMALEAERLAEEWKARLEMATTPELINDPKEITAGEIDPGVLGGGQPGDPVDAEFDPDDSEEEDEAAAAQKAAEKEIENL